MQPFVPTKIKSVRWPCFLYRLLCISFSVTAILGFAFGKPGYQVFLYAALIAAAGAKDIALSRAVAQVVRAVWQSRGEHSPKGRMRKAE